MLGRGSFLGPILLFFRIVSTFWGLSLVLGLAGVSLYRVVAPAEEIEEAEVRRPSEPLASADVPAMPRIGNNPLLLRHPSMLIHLACAEEDALQARTYDPPPPGVQHLVLRLDQSPDVIESIVNGSDTRFPVDAIIAITACFKAAYETGRFP